MLEHNEAFLEAVDAVVVSPSEEDATEAVVVAQCSQGNVGIIWRAETLEDMTSVLERRYHSNPIEYR